MEDIRSERFRVLIIDDEPPIRRQLRIALEANNYRVFEEGTGKEGMVSVAMNHPDVVLLDLGLPDQGGMAILKQLRAWSKIPVIVLTVQDDENTKIEALDLGADDYITKPFNAGELLARVRVAIRHSFKLEESPIFTSGSLWVDLNSRIVKVDHQEIKLTAIEYSLLALFIKYSGKVLTHNFVIKEIWGNPYADNSQTLRVHMAQLRKKIEKTSSFPELLITEAGVGYRLKILAER
ncbi:MAG: response regulator [Bacteroidetes bacterium]|nr:response regulator [Bacteroidota bacterium]